MESLSYLFLAVLAVGAIIAFCKLIELFGRVASLERRLVSGPRFEPVASLPIVEWQPESWPQAPRRPEPARPEPPASSGGLWRAVFGERDGVVDWEVFFGGRMLNVAGAIVLLVGIALLMKYVFDQNWVGPWMRIAGGFTIGTALLAIGAFAHGSRSETRSRWFPQGMFGTGLGVLYITGYAAFSAYHLVPYLAAVVFMAAVTGIALVVGYRKRSLVIVTIGAFGGFLTPIVMGLANADRIELASYIILLDTGLLALAQARPQWFSVRAMALAASYAVALDWHALHPHALHPLLSAFAVLALWALFFVSLAVSSRRDGQSSKWACRARAGVQACNALGASLALATILRHDLSSVAGFELAIAFAFAATWALLVRRSAALVTVRAEYVAGTAYFVAHALFEGASHRSLVLFFATIACTACAAAHRLRNGDGATRREALVVGGLFFSLAVGALELIPDVARHRIDSWAFGLTGPDLALVTIVVAGLTCNGLVRSLVPAAFGRALRAVSLGAIVLLVGVHTSGMTGVAALALSALVPLAADTFARARGACFAPIDETAISACCVLGIAWTQFGFLYASDGAPFAFEAQDVALTALIVSASSIGALLQARLRPLAIALRQSIVLAVALAIGSHAHGLAHWAGLAVAAAACASVGTRYQRRDLEISGLLLVAGSFAGLLSLTSLWHTGDALDFRPFRDERALAVATASLAYVLAGECYRRRSLLNPWIGRGLRLLGAALAIFGTSVEVWDTLDHLSALRGDAEMSALLISAQNLALSGTWVVASTVMLAIGIVGKIREFRLAAIALFDLTILKVFLVDLSGLSSPFRIASFVGLGITLLAVSYWYQRLERRDIDDRPSSLREAIA